MTDNYIKKPVIAIDVDDVLADSVEAYRLQVNARTGADLQPEHYRISGPYWKYFETVWQMHGIADKVPAEELFQQMIVDQSHVPPAPGAACALKKLAKNYDLVVITARYPEWEAATRVWLEQHFPRVFADIHFAGGHDQKERKTKGQMCLEIGATYLLDDNPEHCVSASEVGVQALLFGDFGWHVDVPADMVRCKTWKDVERYFDAERSR